jgi:protein NDRG1
MDSTDSNKLRCVPVNFEWTKHIYTHVVAPYAGPIPTGAFVQKTSTLTVFVQGELNDLGNKTVFVTVHDIGKNHISFVNLVNHSSMEPIRAQSVFMHICLPGQEFGAKDLLDDFPTLDQLGDGLAQVMEKFGVNKCFAIGEGAGADIVCRFAMSHPTLTQGLVLIHCTSTTHGILEHIKEILTNLRLETDYMTQSNWNYLLVHRFGNHDMNESQKLYIDDIKLQNFNLNNLARYIHSFAHRTGFTDQLKSKFAETDVLLLTGDHSTHNDNVRHMFNHMNKSKSGLLIAENTVDVLEESPAQVALAIMLICQRKGIFAEMPLPIPWSMECFSCAPNEGHQLGNQQIPLMSK